MTEKDQPTFRQFYDDLPDRTHIAPKTEFVKKIAGITMKSHKTVRCWLAGVQKPDTLCQTIIEKELGISASILFPETEVTPESKATI